MHVEFEKLEQRPGSHTVPVKMSREDLEALAEKMADVNVRIEAKEENLRAYAKEIREDIKRLEEQRHAITSTYRFKRDPKLVEGLYGFDFENHGQVSCKKCVERSEKDETADVLVGKFDDTEALTKAHEEFEWAPEDKHVLVPVWERPLGTKWFVDPKTGDVFGPLQVTEKDLQKELPPPTQEFTPFQLTFDSETAVPILDAAQVSAAEKKLKETEAERERHAIAEEVHEDCGLPQAWHAMPEGADPETFDGCKQAMIVGANQANDEQARRTQEKYGADEVRDPESTYPCDNCRVETFGRDLQPVTIDGEQKFVCFSCEQNIPIGDADKPKPEEKKKRKGTRKKKGGDATA